MKDGACRAEGPDAFFPVDGGGVEAARKVCATCPVQATCLEYALAHRIAHGVWGGESERSRQRIARQRRRQARSSAA
jgi:WhiB family redox-sensing transcriptional regulator